MLDAPPHSTLSGHTKERNQGLQPQVISEDQHQEQEQEQEQEQKNHEESASCAYPCPSPSHINVDALVNKRDSVTYQLHSPADKSLPGSPSQSSSSTTTTKQLSFNLKQVLLSDSDRAIVNISKPNPDHPQAQAQHPYNDTDCASIMLLSPWSVMTRVLLGFMCINAVSMSMSIVWYGIRCYGSACDITISWRLMNVTLQWYAFGLEAMGYFLFIYASYGRSAVRRPSGRSCLISAIIILSTVTGWAIARQQLSQPFIFAIVEFFNNLLVTGITGWYAYGKPAWKPSRGPDTNVETEDGTAKVQPIEFGLSSSSTYRVQRIEARSPTHHHGYRLFVVQNLYILLICASGIMFFVLFFNTGSNPLHIAMLIGYAMGQFVCREVARLLIPPDFPLTIRLFYPYLIQLFMDLFVIACFQGIHDISTYVIIFMLQASTNLTTPILMKHTVWARKQRLKASLGIKGQYPNQSYEDYILRVSNDYVVNLLGQVNSHILCVGRNLIAYYGVNHSVFLSYDVSSYSFMVALGFTCFQVGGILIQVLIARAMLIRVYGHDPVYVCYYLLRHEWLLFLVTHVCVMCYSFQQPYQIH